MDTIVALSSGLPAAIAIIRLNGDNALSLFKSIFETKQQISPNRLVYGQINLDKLKDKVTAVYFEKDKSFNGEEMVEIFTHASKPVINALINTLINKGARLANAGEFTMRAYLNNKLDLTSAEGIINLINAQTEEQAQSAFDLLDGKLRHKIDMFQDKLVRLIAYIDADLDYPEENVADENRLNLKNNLIQLIEEISQLKESYNQGRLIKDGIRILLLGKTNVGKSSLINAMLGKDRVIVSQQEGTTRDIIETTYLYKGQKFILVDGAGIRQSNDEIENIGIKKTLDECKTADLVIEIATKDKDFINLGHKNTIQIENMCDLATSNRDVLKISALKNINIDRLKEVIYQTTLGEKSNQDVQIITELRHYNCLESCLNSLNLVINDIDDPKMIDCVSAELHEAYNKLGEITGIIGNDQIVHEIFSNFCVGK